MKKAALYVRVSTDEQRKHGLSVDNQIEALKSYCKENNIKVAQIYNDAGHSARKKYTTRPAMVQLLEDCKKGKFQIVLFTRIDRWFRSVADYHAIQEVLTENNVSWQAIWEDYETETSAGRFKVNIMLSVSESEADRTSEKIKSVKEYLREQGRFVGGHIPRGYLFSNGTLIKDEATAEAITGFFEHYLQHGNIRQAMMYLQSHGVAISRQSCVRMLKADYYIGKHKTCEFEPYITQEQHLKILSMMQSAPRNEAKRVYIFSGLLKCPLCGGRLGGVPHQIKYTKKDGTQVKTSSAGYRCVKNHVSTDCSFTRVIFQKSIEKFLIQSLDDIILKKRLSASFSAKTETLDVEKAIAKLEAKMSRIGARFEDGDISLEEYRNKRDSVKAEIEQLQNSKDDSEFIAPEMPENWKDIYNTLDEDHKQLFWHKIINKIIVGEHISDEPKVYFLH